MAELQIMTAYVNDDNGETVATVERVKIGGGVQVVTVDGVPEERAHPTFWLYHVRLLSPDRMIPDELRETETYDRAVELAFKYAERRAEHAKALDELAASLKI